MDIMDISIYVKDDKIEALSSSMGNEGGGDEYWVGSLVGCHF